MSDAETRTIYFGDWAAENWDKKLGREAMAKDFNAEVPPDGDILLAWYSYEDYSGSAFVLFKKGDDLFEVNGGHCSCNGLEGQWDPKPTTWGALAMRKVAQEGNKPYSMPESVRSRLRALIAEHVPA